MMKIIGDVNKTSKAQLDRSNKFAKYVDSDENIEFIHAEITNDGVVYKILYDNNEFELEDYIINNTVVSYGDNIEYKIDLLKIYLNVKINCGYKYSSIISKSLFKNCKSDRSYKNFCINTLSSDLIEVKRINGILNLRLRSYDEFLYIHKCMPRHSYSYSDDKTINITKESFIVYKFLNDYNDVLYIGKTVNINQRMFTHFGNSGHLGKDKYDQVTKIEYIICENNADMSIKEIYFINRYKPPFNTSSLFDGEVKNEVYDSIEWKNKFDMSSLGGN